MAFVSIYTVGRLNHPHDHPATREFYQVGNEIYREAMKTGLIEAFLSDGVTLPEENVPGTGTPILTLTVWKNLESLYSFTYSGQHKQALRNRGRWIEAYPEKHLSYVVWWTESVMKVSWEEAFKRYKYYIQNGPTPFAFDFKHAFDEKGEKLVIK